VLNVTGPENAIRLKAEGERIFNLLPKCIPAMKNGKAVSVKHTVPLTFKLQ